MALAVTLGVAAHAAGERSIPYAGLESRDIKGLSEQEVAELTMGKGMGMALPAELNGHPGPLHVLELADKLGLSPDQRHRTQTAMTRMRKRAIALGKDILNLEKALEAEFRAPHPKAERVESLTGEIGRLRGALRAVHLVAHLEMNRILDARQKISYAQHRGYAMEGTGEKGHGSRH